MIWGQLGVLALSIAIFLGTLHLAGHTRRGPDSGTTLPGSDAEATRAERRVSDSGPGSRRRG